MDLSFNKEKLIEKYKPDFAMAYGSGVFRQDGYAKDEKPMVDFIFGVNNSVEWHERNLTENGLDYSLISRLGGPKFVNWLQGIGTGIFYNPYVDFEGQTIKYGVISIKDLLDDLNNWTSMYVAGRLHKPVEILKSDVWINRAIQNNLEYAIDVALFLLPEQFKERDLYEMVAGLSYLGDSRMKFGENPEKIKNIVNGNFNGFKKLYYEIFEKEFSRDKHNLLDRLPQNLKKELLERVISMKAEDSLGKEDLRDAISSIVHSSSISQTIKGLVSAGLIKSVRYAMEKMEKAGKLS